MRKAHVFLLSLLGSTCSFGRLGGGDPDPRLMAALSPSPLYWAIMLPSLAAALAVLVALHRADWPKHGRPGARGLLSAGCGAILSGLALFGAYPQVYRRFFGMYLEHTG